MAYVYEDKSTEIQKKKLIESLEKTSKDISQGKHIEDELTRVWNKVKTDAYIACPKDTGTLAGTIRVVASEVADAGLGSSDKSITMFDRAIIAGDITKTNPKTKGPCNYAQFVHDGYMRRDGAIYIGVPFLSYALALNEMALEDAIDKALQKLGKEFSEGGN